MKAMLQIAVLGATLAACASSGDTSKKAATVGDVAFDAPSDWVQKSAKTGGVVASALWAPDENPNKESVEIIRSSDARKDLTTAKLSQLLVEAQHALPQGHASRGSTFTTLGGRVGARVDADFVPVGLHTTYHRIHAAILDESGVVIHVLYTAATPDADLKAFNMILQSIHRGEA